MATTDNTTTTAVSIQFPANAIAGLRESFGEDLSRAALEGFVAEGYRSGKLGIGQVRQLLGFETRESAERWLGSRGICWNYDQDDLEADRATLQRLFPVDGK